MSGLGGHPAQCPGLGLRHGYLLAGRQTLVQSPSRLIGEHPDSIHGDFEVGAAVLNGLERSDGTSELDPVAGVFHHHLQYHLGPAQGLGALGHGGPLHRPVQSRPSLGDLAQHRVTGQRHVVELNQELRIVGDGLHGGLDHAAGLGIHQDQGYIRPGPDGGTRRADDVAGQPGVWNKETFAAEGQAAIPGCGL